MWHVLTGDDLTPLITSGFTDGKGFASSCLGDAGDFTVGGGTGAAFGITGDAGTTTAGAGAVGCVTGFTFLQHTDQFD